MSFKHSEGPGPRNGCAAKPGGGDAGPTHEDIERALAAMTDPRGADDRSSVRRAMTHDEIFDARPRLRALPSNDRAATATRAHGRPATKPARRSHPAPARPLSLVPAAETYPSAEALERIAAAIDLELRKSRPGAEARTRSEASPAAAQTPLAARSLSQAASPAPSERASRTYGSALLAVGLLSAGALSALFLSRLATSLPSAAVMAPAPAAPELEPAPAVPAPEATTPAAELPRAAAPRAPERARAVAVPARAAPRPAPAPVTGGPAAPEWRTLPAPASVAAREPLTGPVLQED